MLCYLKTVPLHKRQVVVDCLNYCYGQGGQEMQFLHLCPILLWLGMLCERDRGTVGNRDVKYVEVIVLSASFLLRK